MFSKIFSKTKLNNKGQAAATDALIFLSIVAIVFVFILGYSMNYGNSIMDSAKKLYNNNYHYSALKAFMSASYGRDGKDILESVAQDSVATMIKEDYGANSLKQAEDSSFPDENLISQNTKIAVFKTLDDLFKILPQRSYMLLISHNKSESGNSGIIEPLILFLKTYIGDASEGSFESMVCYPKNEAVEKYLGNHTLNLELAEGSFILFRNILAAREQPETKKEDGSIVLGSWVTNPEPEENIITNFETMRCESYTNIVYPEIVE